MPESFSAPMSTKEIATIGVEMYGRNWQAAMARDLGIDSSTIRRWNQENPPIGPIARVALRALLQLSRAAHPTAGTVKVVATLGKSKGTTARAGAGQTDATMNEAD